MKSEKYGLDGFCYTCSFLALALALALALGFKLLNFSGEHTVSYIEEILKKLSELYEQMASIDEDYVSMRQARVLHYTQLQDLLTS